MIDAECTKLAERLDALRDEHREDWFTEKEKHKYKDGTTHFNHVRYKSERMDGATVEVASHVTPNLAELLCLLHNNLDMIVTSLRERRK